MGLDCGIETLVKATFDSMHTARADDGMSEADMQASSPTPRLSLDPHLETPLIYDRVTMLQFRQASAPQDRCFAEDLPKMYSRSILATIASGPNRSTLDAEESTDAELSVQKHCTVR